MHIARETWIVFARAMRLSLRNPVWVVIGMTQPLLYLGLFGPLLEPVTQVPGMPAGDSWQWFVPGILVQMGNPFRHVVDGARAIFAGDLTSSTTLWGLVVTLVLVAVGVTAGTRTFRRESA